MALTKEEIIEAIAKMNLLEVRDLVRGIEERFGIEGGMMFAAGGVGVAAGGPVAVEEEKEEKTEFDVILTSFGANKIRVIKEIREITGLGLKEAKDLVEGAPAPVKEKIPKEEAEKIKKQLEEAGASVEIK